MYKCTGHGSPDATETIHVSAEPFAAAAEQFACVARERIGVTGRCAVSLAGGSTPRALYERLAADDHGVEWPRVNFLWGDERAVSPDHPDSNYRMAQESLLGPLGIDAKAIHRMPAERPDLDAAARDYECTIARVLGVSLTANPRLDLVLLGMGVDGHTASLFPETAALFERGRWIVANHVPQLGADRMTQTLGLINHAHEVWILISGAAKSEMLHRVLAHSPDEHYPIQSVKPVAGRLRWFVDNAAWGDRALPPDRGRAGG